MHMNTLVNVVATNTSTGATAALPLGSATYSLFNSFTAFGGTDLASLGVNRLEFSVKNDQSATLQLFESQDGSTWDHTETDQAVTAPAAGDITGPIDFVIDGYRYVKLLWVNGGSNQTVFRANLSLIGDRARGS